VAPDEIPPSGLNVWLVEVMASRLVHSPLAPPVRCCILYRLASATSLQEIVNVSPDSSTPTPYVVGRG